MNVLKTFYIFKACTGNLCATDSISYIRKVDIVGSVKMMININLYTLRNRREINNRALSLYLNNQ